MRAEHTKIAFLVEFQRLAGTLLINLFSHSGKVSVYTNPIEDTLAEHSEYPNLLFISGLKTAQSGRRSLIFGSGLKAESGNTVLGLSSMPSS